MTDEIGEALVSMVAASYSTSTPQVKGILIDRDPPITVGWCGNDNCEHAGHKAKRVAQAAADKKAKK